MVNKSKIIKAYNQKKKELGKIPKATDLSSSYQKTIRKNFDNYFDFLKEVGDFEKYSNIYQSISYNSLRTIDNAKITNELQDLYKLLGYPPRPKHYKRRATAINRFGSWRKALAAAGIKGTYYNDFSGCISKEELIVRCKKEVQILGRFPKWSDLRAKKFPVTEIPYYFKNWDEFAKATGYLSLRAKQRQKHLNKLQILQKSAEALFGKGKKITYNNLISKSNLSQKEIKVTIEAAYRLKIIKHRRLAELLVIDRRIFSNN